jgi:predicted negative regulator of RcsB-dependent stress response
MGVRIWSVVLAAAFVAASACGPKREPSIAPGPPRYPAFTQPAVPGELAQSDALSPYNLGWRLFQSGDVRNAARAYATALQKAPGFYPAHAANGDLELAREQPEAALGHFDAALGARADYVPALIGRGEALAALNREPDAAAAFEAALAADPSLTDLRTRIDVLRVRGMERQVAGARDAARANRYDEAVRLYEQAIASSPDSAFLYRELAGVERRAGNADQALESLRRATTLDGADAASFAQIGEILESRDDLEGAAAAYGSALAVEETPAVETRRSAVLERLALSRLPEEYRNIPASAEVTRGELAALIGIRLGPVLQGAAPVDAVVMTDVRSTWAEPWIMSVTRAGVMRPFDNHTFQPRSVVLRVDLAQVVERLLGRIAALAPGDARAWQNARGQFADMDAANLAYPAASAAIAAGVMTATDGVFQPTRPVSGAEAVAAVRRLEQLARLPERAARR